MAETQNQSDDQTFLATAGALLRSTRDSVNGAIEVVSEPLLRDGYVGAAFRQGIDELWQALRPSQDGIQAQEPGALFEPLQSEVAAARQPAAQSMSLGDILNTNSPSPPQQSNEKDMGQSL